MFAATETVPGCGVNLKGGCVEPSGKLIDVFEQIQGAQLELCDQLEKIADSLPKSVDRQACIHIAQALSTVINKAHETEETVFYPILENAGRLVVNAPSIVEHLRMDHLGDAFMAEEIVEVLMSYGAGEPLHEPEAAGYMLRGFFTGLRRHIAMEGELLRPALAQRDADEAGNIH